MTPASMSAPRTSLSWQSMPEAGDCRFPPWCLKATNSDAATKMPGAAAKLGDWNWNGEI
jgi:hypothetical protein